MAKRSFALIMCGILLLVPLIALAQDEETPEATPDVEATEEVPVVVEEAEEAAEELDAEAEAEETEDVDDVEELVEEVEDDAEETAEDEEEVADEEEGGLQGSGLLLFLLGIGAVGGVGAYFIMVPDQGSDE